MKTKRFAVLLFVAVFAVLVVAGCTPQTERIPTAALPAGKAWAEGKEIFFVHTEASDSGVAEKLTSMMKSPVIFVPSLAKMPADALAQVYVFTNGVAGKGPFGFQSDVFPNPPGTDGYSPLRNINAVTWADPAKARELKAVAEVMAAKDAGEVTIEQPGIVVNMPFVVWDGGKR
ncbi:MAG: hypothetical protein WAW03_23580 [Anaerolineae bacterium]|uniref:DUF7482 domain-containing protein n=1 Tax=Candidatus Amarolinea dominans TaxID=3140696 RepID=UPI001D63C7C2|nr:hypothetical protein [Anaerolineae bacterium]MBK7199631.1 hypothetical protein [Anaerolineae bacterium]MBK9094210.1 hypothetical protein [Anaerolineae bacterium]MBK9234034.1 hypothetical protein [Anaerolineae bacterium]